MATNQELRQASVRAVTGTAYTYNDDWMALFVSAGITSGTFNDRLLVWINTMLETSFQNINDAKRAFALDQGFASWDQMGTFEAAPAETDILAGAGSFTSADGWTLVSGTTISGGTFNADGSNGNGAAFHSTTVTQGVSYTVAYTVALTAGSMRIRFAAGTGALTFSTQRTTSGSFSETMVALGDGAVQIQVIGLNGTVDNLTVTPV